MPRSIISSQISGARAELKDRVLPSCLPSPGKGGSCLQARLMTHGRFLSKSSCCFSQSPSPSLSHEKKDDAEMMVPKAGRGAAGQLGPTRWLHPSWQRVNKQIKDFVWGPLNQICLPVAREIPQMCLETWGRAAWLGKAQTRCKE